MDAFAGEYECPSVGHNAIISADADGVHGRWWCPYGPQDYKLGLDENGTRIWILSPSNMRKHRFEAKFIQGGKLAALEFIDPTKKMKVVWNRLRHAADHHSLVEFEGDYVCIEYGDLRAQITPEHRWVCAVASQDWALHPESKSRLRSMDCPGMFFEAERDITGRLLCLRVGKDGSSGLVFRKRQSWGSRYRRVAAVYTPPFWGETGYGEVALYANRPWQRHLRYLSIEPQPLSWCVQEYYGMPYLRYQYKPGTIVSEITIVMDIRQGPATVHDHSREGQEDIAADALAIWLQEEGSFPGKLSIKRRDDTPTLACLEVQELCRHFHLNKTKSAVEKVKRINKLITSLSGFKDRARLHGTFAEVANVKEYLDKFRKLKGMFGDAALLYTVFGRASGSPTRLLIQMPQGQVTAELHDPHHGWIPTEVASDGQWSGFLSPHNDDQPAFCLTGDWTTDSKLLKHNPVCQYLLAWYELAFSKHIASALPAPAFNERRYARPLGVFTYIRAGSHGAKGVSLSRIGLPPTYNMPTSPPNAADMTTWRHDGVTHVTDRLEVTEPKSQKQIEREIQSTKAEKIRDEKDRSEVMQRYEEILKKERANIDPRDVRHNVLMRRKQQLADDFAIVKDTFHKRAAKHKDESDADFDKKDSLFTLMKNAKEGADRGSEPDLLAQELWGLASSPSFIFAQLKAQKNRPLSRGPPGQSESSMGSPSDSPLGSRPNSRGLIHSNSRMRNHPSQQKLQPKMSFLDARNNTMRITELKRHAGSRANLNSAGNFGGSMTALPLDIMEGGDGAMDDLFT